MVIKNNSTRVEDTDTAANQVFPNVIAALGNTPVVQLNAITHSIRTPVVAKLEMTNPGGSVKDRIGIRMVEEAERKGWLRPGGTIVEPTSGNTGVGLAMAAAVRGYHCIFVMPDKVAPEKVALLRAYGAEVVTTPTAVERDSPESYYSVADRLTREVPGAFQPNQYFNPMNPRTHYETTGPEIWDQTGGQVTHFVAGVGTGGTVSGISRYLKEQKSTVEVIGADPEGSIYTTDQLHTYKVEGVGEDFWPGTFDRNSVDRWVQVSDRDAFLTARAVTRQEGILIGGSGGLAVWAALEVARAVDDPTAMVVVLLPDSGRGYLSKVYSDDWMRENGFLSRFSGPTRLGQLIDRFSPELPDVIAVACDDTIENAIEVLRFHEISQVPVVRSRQTSEGIEIQSIVGSLQERTLLDHLFRNPDIVSAQVSTIMDAPFNLVDANEEIERVFPLFGSGAPAVLVQQEGRLVGVVTRSDLLEFAARQPRRRA
ncbi:MAG: cystathionine beta-synthase [Thermomicrobiales bacterium]|nr:cystathionine beta-synthase [Thermomicrobiales bacterium]MCO5223647.1 cystathionine beta-synthase [Thermomicrobiales bacterium]